MDKGVPIDCSYFETEECSTSERWPGMWQVPVWWLTKDGSEDGEPYRCAPPPRARRQGWGKQAPQAQRCLAAACKVRRGRLVSEAGASTTDRGRP